MSTVLVPLNVPRGPAPLSALAPPALFLPYPIAIERENSQAMADHYSPRPTRSCNRRNHNTAPDEYERVGI